MVIQYEQPEQRMKSLSGPNHTLSLSRSEQHGKGKNTTGARRSEVWDASRRDEGPSGNKSHQWTTFPSLELQMRLRDRYCASAIQAREDALLRMPAKTSSHPAWPSAGRASDRRIQLLASYEATLSQPESARLRRLRWTWHYDLQAMANIVRELLRGYGTEALAVSFH